MEAGGKGLYINASGSHGLVADFYRDSVVR